MKTKYYYENERLFLTQNHDKENCCKSCFFGDADCNLADVIIKKPSKTIKLSAATICFSRGNMYFTNPA